MKLPNRITTTAEAPPGEYQSSLYLSLYVQIVNIFSSHKFGFGNGPVSFFGGQSVFGGASQFSNLLAPRATGPTGLMSRPVTCRVFCLQTSFVDCLIEQTHPELQAKNGKDVSQTPFGSSYLEIHHV